MIKKRVLITGGAGFIGKKLSNFLLAKDFDVLVLDNLFSGNLKGLNKNIHFKKVDILDKEKLESQFEEFNPDYVFHLAAISTRLPGESKDLMNVNVEGTINVLECIVRRPVKKFIYSSSASVYGNTQKLPTPEGVRPKPLSLYGVSKVKSETFIKSVLKDSIVPYSILRFSNVYGEGQGFDNEGGIISIICNNIKNRQKTTIFDDGQQTRDFIYVDDVVKALYESMFCKPNIVLNVSTKQETSINGLIDLIKSVTGKDTNIEYKPNPINEIKRSVLDNSKIKRLINWNPSINLKDGVLLTYKWVSH